MLVGQSFQVAAARPGGVHGKKAADGDWIVRGAMGNRGFDDDDVQFFHRHTLTVPLAEIEGRGSDGGQQEDEAAVADDCARAHVVIITHHRGEVALFVFQLESAVTARNEFHLQREGAVV